MDPGYKLTQNFDFDVENPGEDDVLSSSSHISASQVKSSIQLSSLAYETLNAHIQELQSELLACKTTNSTLEEVHKVEVSRLQSLLASSTESRAKALHTNKKLEEQVKLLGQQLERERLATISQKSIIATQSDEIEKYKSKISQLQQGKRTLEDDAKENSEYTTAICEKLEAEKEELSRLVSELSSVKETQKSTIKSQQDKIDSLELAKKSESSSHLHLQNQHSTLLSSLSLCETEKRDAKRELEELKEKYRLQTSEYQRYRIDVENDLKSKKETISSLSIQLKSMHSEVRKTEETSRTTNERQHLLVQMMETTMFGLFDRISEISSLYATHVSSINSCMILLDTLYKKLTSDMAGFMSDSSNAEIDFKLLFEATKRAILYEDPLHSSLKLPLSSESHRLGMSSLTYPHAIIAETVLEGTGDVCGPKGIKTQTIRGDLDNIVHVVLDYLTKIEKMVVVLVCKNKESKNVMQFSRNMHSLSSQIRNHVCLAYEQSTSNCEYVTKWVENMERYVSKVCVDKLASKYLSSSIELHISPKKKEREREILVETIEQECQTDPSIITISPLSHHLPSTRKPRMPSSRPPPVPKFYK
ncbi:hypothetical protein ADUPG1_000535 [Aduncisulcus paluster]|uniref:Uncharacterized protein n=1 Tax=Aduncisulcus paluster TaxID=2918883 RepID=A0ABQ5K6S0_9EUKA|nr:hypothetical protein ADUPG1_000535 [Aduncisulcus paluster]